VMEKGIFIRIGSTDSVLNLGKSYVWVGIL
jgi:hypothetical protein